MPVSAQLQSALEQYGEIWHGEPDSFQKQDNPLLPTMAQGKHGALQANCLTQQARVDFNISALPSQVPPTTVVLIDDPASLRRELSRITNVLDKNNAVVPNPIWRVALILRFLNLKTKQIEANRSLDIVMENKCGHSHLQGCLSSLRLIGCIPLLKKAVQGQCLTYGEMSV
jgi:hypothetical protein